VNSVTLADNKDYIQKKSIEVRAITKTCKPVPNTLLTKFASLLVSFFKLNIDPSQPEQRILSLTLNTETLNTDIKTY
jgi:hypothetical protein